jgi:phage terminase large subunit-like protein
VESLALLPPSERAKILSAMSPEETLRFRYAWRNWWARPGQLAPPGEWSTWLLMAGRFFGKTRCGAEWIHERVNSGVARYIALVAPTAADARDVMVQGPAGILATAPPWAKPVYYPSVRRVTWPNGTIATTYSAEEPERLRGPQHDTAWCDEVAAWRHPEAFDMLAFGMRLGNDPRVVVTTTPRPVKLVRELLADQGRGVVVTRGTSYENASNVPEQVFKRVQRYEGTRLGRQELLAELLEDVPGALWSRGLLDATRVREKPAELVRVVVAIDPAVTSGEDSDETGIIVAGKDARGHGYVLADCSGRYQPAEWAKTAIAAYHTHEADQIVAEVNNGGDMVEATLRMVDRNIPFKAVHASRGKVTRAQPVAQIYEEGRAHHLGSFAKLEDQMAEFTIDFDRAAFGYSPDRVDALVWALSDLLVEPMSNEGIFELYRQRAAKAAAEKAERERKPAPTPAPGSVEWFQMLNRQNQKPEG